ncbi:unnamed protein product [Haemonchus placei]|uniref:Uncharacterized protein n=1 Tax=Haemonchus placei TaxID=6290 RepID=A0A3P7Y3C8_HAEPC|nr:unnamed protein product [Haemonchus placei]
MTSLDQERSTLVDSMSSHQAARPVDRRTVVACWSEPNLGLKSKSDRSCDASFSFSASPHLLPRNNPDSCLHLPLLQRFYGLF